MQFDDWKAEMVKTTDEYEAAVQKLTGLLDMAESLEYAPEREDEVNGFALRAMSRLQNIVAAVSK